MLIEYRAFLYGSIVSVDWKENKSAKAFFAVLNPSLVMEFVVEIRVDYIVKPAYSGTPMSSVCPGSRQVSLNTGSSVYVVYTVNEWLSLMLYMREVPRSNRNPFIGYSG